MNLLYLLWFKEMLSVMFHCNEGGLLEVELVPVLPELRIGTVLSRPEIRKHSTSYRIKIVSSLIKKNKEAMIGIRGPKEIQLNPLDRVVEQFTRVQNIHC